MRDPRNSYLRRRILTTIIGGLFAPGAYSAGKCRPEPSSGLPYCVVGVRSAVLDHKLDLTGVATEQQRSQWCWAACISIIFAYHGHEVSQDEIVARVKGAPVNMPGRGDEITRALNSHWMDVRGRRFVSRARIWDVLGGRFDLEGNPDVIRELASDRPLVSGAAGHATVVTAMEYLETPMGPMPTRVIVRDPWPGRGRRVLSLEEANPIYIAAVEVR